MFWQILKGHTKEWESFIGEKREGFRDARTGGWWCGEAVGGLIKSRASYVMVRGAHWMVSGWSSVGSKDKY